MASKKVTRKKASDTPAASPSTDKFPQLRKAMDELRAEKEKILGKSGPLREQRDKLIAKIQPLDAEMRALSQQIEELEGNRPYELDNQIAALARTMGARSMSQPTES
jgi:uncharacterized coiled-coil DUF342 family protein